jgi:ClpA/ClpB-like protein
MFARFSPGAREVTVRAGDLAAAAGRDRIGTEFLLLALCEDPRAGAVLRAHGVTAPAVQAAVAGALGRPRPHTDRELLAVLGIDLDEVRRRAGQAGGLGAARLWRVRRSRVWPLRVAVVGPGRDLAFTGGARKVLEVALWRRRRRSARLAGPADLLHGILCDRRSNAARIMSHLRVNGHALLVAMDDAATAT